MKQTDVIGQQECREQLRQELIEGKIPHARLITGPAGSGKLALAISYAQALCCKNRINGHACGTCPDCIKTAKFMHPDLHFAFPIIKRAGAKEPVCDDFIGEWRELLAETRYFDLQDWLKMMRAENQQPIIYVKESEEIIKKLSLKSSQGGYKVVIIWLPEKMNLECSNKMLKILEEPPAETVFLLVSEEPDLLLPTILSRAQRFQIPPIEEDALTDVLKDDFALQPGDAKHIAHYAQGNFLKAMKEIHLNEEQRVYFDLFVNLMRKSYMRDIRSLKAWSEEVAGLGREKQKDFLQYTQHMVRENFIYNFHTPETIFLDGNEAQFATKFAPFINEKNVIGLMDEFEEAQYHIEQNVNAKMVFFDLALKVIVLIVKQ